MLTEFKQWLCGRTSGHTYSKVYDRKKEGYVFKCVKCGKPREEQPKGFC